MSHIYTYICIPSQRFFGAGQVPRDDRRCQMANRSIGKQRGEGWGMAMDSMDDIGAV